MTTSKEEFDTFVKDRHRRDRQRESCERGNTSRQIQRFVLGTLRHRAKGIAHNPDEALSTRVAFKPEISKLKAHLDDIPPQIDCDSEYSFP